MSARGCPLHRQAVGVGSNRRHATAGLSPLNGADPLAMTLQVVLAVMVGATAALAPHSRVLKAIDIVARTRAKADGFFVP